MYSNIFNVYECKFLGVFIVSRIHNGEMEYLDYVEYQLSLVYRDGIRGNIEFQYGLNENLDKYELFLFHLNKKFLKEATAKIKKELETRIGDKWIVYIEK